MSEIDAPDVSVVVQGPVGEWTQTVLESVHEYLPGSQLVLSTWRGSGSAQLRALATVVVENDDPGGGPAVPPMSTNRMVLSTSAGLARADRPFAMKFRSDTPLTSAAALAWQGVAPTPPACLFSQRLLTCSVATRPSATHALHHLSDCFHFGPTADLRSLWQPPHVSEEENGRFWSRQGRPSPWGWDARFANEQLLWLGYLNRRGVSVEYPFLGAETTAADQALSTRLIADSFVVLEPWQIGLSLPKLAPVIRASALASYVGYEDWLEAATSLR